MRALEVIKSYRDELRQQTGTQSVIVPAEIKSEKFFVSLSVLPHPLILENGRCRLRLRGTVEATIPASDKAINDCLKRSLALAQFFGESQGFPILPGAHYGMAHHKSLREDDDLFADLTEDRGYVYAESWLIELEFDTDILS